MIVARPPEVEALDTIPVEVGAVRPLDAPYSHTCDGEKKGSSRASKGAATIRLLSTVIKRVL